MAALRPVPVPVARLRRPRGHPLIGAATEHSPSPSPGEPWRLRRLRRLWLLGSCGGSSWLVGRVGAGGRHDRVPKGCARIGCGRHRVPEGALYDPNYPQRVICPDYLRSVVPVGTMCRCPGADRLPDEDLAPVGHAVDLKPRLSTTAATPISAVDGVGDRSEFMSMRSRQPTDAGCEPALPLADCRVIARRWRHAGRRDLQSRPTLVCPATDPARWPAGPGPCWLRCASGLGISILGRDACPYRADSVRLGLRARHQGVVRTLKAPAEAVGYQPRNWPWLAHNVASEAATAAAITATTRRRTGRSADQRRPRATARRVSPITM